jgi:diacylglycerol kinase
MKRKNLRNSFKYAFNGIKLATKEETNMRIHIVIMVLVIIAGFCFRISIIEWLICLICFGLVIAAEMINTAIETVVDMAMPKINEKAKIAKDVAAGAVLVMAIISAIIGLIIFIPKL